MPRKGYGEKKRQTAYLREQWFERIRREAQNQPAGQPLPAHPDSDEVCEDKDDEEFQEQEKGGEDVGGLMKKVEALEKKVEMLEGNTGKLQQMVASLEMRVKMLEQQARRPGGQSVPETSMLNKKREVMDAEDGGGIALESEELMETH